MIFTKGNSNFYVFPDHFFQGLTQPAVELLYFVAWLVFFGCE